MKITPLYSTNFNKVARQKTQNQEATRDASPISFGVNYSYYPIGCLKVPTKYYHILDSMACNHNCSMDALRCEAHDLCKRAEEEEKRYLKERGYVQDIFF